MKGVILLISSYSELEIPTAQCVNELRAAGAQLVLEKGSSDVSQARNSALNAACEIMRERSEFDVVLMMDADIICKVDTARQLVAEARATGLACSAAYATGDARLAGSKWPNPDGGPWPDGRVRWQVGLGCLAIPKALLFEVESRCSSFEVRGKVFSEFTWSKAENGEWIAEDYRLSRQLGGVKLMPLGVGHWKKGEYFPDDETLAAIRENRMVQPLPSGKAQ